MTVNDVAQRLGVSLRAVQRWIHVGWLRAERHGRDWWIESAPLTEFQRRHPGPYRKGRPRKV